MPRARKKEMNVNAKGCNYRSKGMGGCGYFLGFIGAAIYYVSAAAGFWAGVLGILKALVWPAFLVFELLKFLAA